jgi:NADPH-dependent 7-cyano-7-deazaguanine reductase QueF
MKLNTKTETLVAYQNFTHEPDWTQKKLNRLGSKVANGLKHMKHYVLQFRTSKHQNVGSTSN